MYAHEEVNEHTRVSLSLSLSHFVEHTCSHSSGFVLLDGVEDVDIRQECHGTSEALGRLAGLEEASCCSVGQINKAR